jgi:hypothetical protein
LNSYVTIPTSLTKAFTNAQKQARFRKRNVLILTGSAEHIAKKLLGMADQDKLRKVYRLLGKHAKR